MMMVELVSTKREDMKMVTFADDFSAVGHPAHLSRTFLIEPIISNKIHHVM